MKYLYLILILLITYGCKDTSNSSVEIPPTRVTTAVTVQIDIPNYITLPGSTLSVHSVEIQARVEGWLIERRFIEGGMVQRGDLLYILDSAPYEAQLQQAESALAAAEVQAVLAADTYKRNSPLAEFGAISVQDLENFETQAVVTALDVELNEAQVAAAKINVEYCFIHSPITGRIGKTAINIGSLAGPGGTSKLAEVVQLSPMYVEFYPPSTRLHMIQESIDGGVQLPVQIAATQDDSEGQPSINSSVTAQKKYISGSLVFIDNAVQSTTSTFLARGEFINDAGILPGQYVEVRLQIQVIQDAIMVPIDAVALQPGGYYVWTVTKDSTAKITPVTLGVIEGKLQHVLSGLHAGDTVIVNGMTKLRAGEKVTITNKVSK